MDGWEEEKRGGQGVGDGWVLVRGRWAGVEARRDREWLVRAARFRFVSAAVLGLRFGVSVQQVNARLRRLEAAGLVARTDGGVGRARLVSVTARGCRAVGAPVRRAARTDVQREHELELAWLVARLELRVDGAVVRTERESRARECAGAAARYSVDVIDRSGRRERRWPDLVIEGPTGRRAVEFERTAKGRSRLERIVAAYRLALWFDEVHFLAGGVDVARRLATALRAEPDGRLLAAPWPRLPAPTRAAVTAALTDG